MKRRPLGSMPDPGRQPPYDPGAMPRLTIPTRIFLSMMLLLAAFGGVSAASMVQHQRTAARLRLLHEGYLPLAIAVGELKGQQATVGPNLDRLIELRDPSWMRRVRNGRPQRIARSRRDIRRARRFVLSDDDSVALREIGALLDEIERASRDGSDDFTALVDALDDGDEQRANDALGRVRQSEQFIRARLDRLWVQLQARISATSRVAAEQESEFLKVVAGLSFLAVLIGMVVIWWSQRLLAPLPRLQQRVAAVARGDFAQKITAARDDEIGKLTIEFERMVEAVSARDRRLRDAADSLRELQRTQEQIVAGLRAGVVVVDSASIVRSANEAARSVLGLGPEAIDTSLEETGLAERLPGLTEAIDDVVVEGGERAALVAAPIEDGLDGDEATTRYVDVLITPFGMRDEDDPRRAVLIVADDTTEELLTKQRLIHSERLAAIGRMAAHVTHEVRNPLSSIGLNVELLEEEIGSHGTEARALIRAITREIDRLTALTEEYLRLARLPTPQLEPEDVGELVDEVGRFVAREFETQNVTLCVEVESNLPLVAADEAQIRQALLNLLRNARESMPDGGEVRMWARRERDGMTIGIEDEGEGIDEATKSRIFDLFYSTKERGTGLGLPLTDQIVSAHGGTIECVDSGRGGTRFVMWLPAAPDGRRGRDDDVEPPARVAAMREE